MEFRSGLICRACLQEKAELFPIFDEAHAMNGVLLSEMLTECTQYKVVLGDDLPNKLCALCKEAAYNAFYFKRQTEEAHRKLLRILEVDVVTSRLMYDKTKDICTQTDHFSIHPCELCGEKYFDIYELRQHRLLEHKSNDKKCRICGENFMRLRQLKSHLLQEHPHDGLTNAIKCHVCQRKFTRRDHLTRHMRNIHKHNILSSSKKSLEEPEIDLKLGNKDDTNVSDSSDSDTNCDESGFTATNPISSGDEDFDKNKSDVPEIKIEPDFTIKDEPAEHPFPDSQADIKTEAALQTESKATQETSPIAVKEEYSLRTRQVQIVTAEEMPSVRGKIPKSKDNRCTVCQRTFSRHCHLQRHMLTHFNKKAHACPKCSKRFARSDHLKSHVINVHNAKEFKCDQCDGEFARSETLKYHKEAKHGTDPNALKVHDCEFCDKKFTSKSYLVKHKLLHTDRLFACRHCDETYQDRKSWREHEKSHLADRNYLCSICGDSFVRNDYLLVHMRRHTGEKPYKCQYCGKGFPRATDVKVHERYHTNTKPNLCNLCGKGFHRAYNLTIHMRTHTGERPFKCTQCPKSFAQSNDLKAHIRRHTGERFKCGNCNASFLQLYCLRQHSLGVHGIQIESATGRLQKFPTTTAPQVKQTISTQNPMEIDAQEDFTTPQPPADIEHILC